MTKFQVVENMRAGVYNDIVRRTCYLSDEAINLLDKICEEQELTRSEAFSCILTGNIITYGDGTYTVHPDLPEE